MKSANFCLLDILVLAMFIYLFTRSRLDLAPDKVAPRILLYIATGMTKNSHKVTYDPISTLRCNDVTGQIVKRTATTLGITLRRLWNRT